MSVNHHDHWYKALISGGFKYVWPITRKPFRSFFRTHGATMPMLFVEQYNSNFDRHLDPETDTFVDDVNVLLNEPALVRDFFAKSKWAAKQMMARLDRRALARLRFPNFPSHLDEVPCDVPALTPELLGALRS